MANTLANLGRLGKAAQLTGRGSSAPLRIGAVSITGSDVLGSFHQAEMDKADVQTLSTALSGSCTGESICQVLSLSCPLKLRCIPIVLHAYRRICACLVKIPSNTALMLLPAGTVIVLTTPDANRTFLSYLGTSQELSLNPAIETQLHRSRLVIIEGYVWEMPNASASISQVSDLISLRSAEKSTSICPLV